MGASKAAIDALKQALALEKSGQEFYTQAAARTTDAKGKEMFRSLADDEVMHAEVIQRQVDALAKGEGWIIPEGIGAVDADLESPLFPEGKVALEQAVQPDASDLDALLFALKIENDTFNLYAEQAKLAEDPNAKRLYEYLVHAERTHFNLVMLNYESLSSAGNFV
jgi:rubrerythrin